MFLGTGLELLVLILKISDTTWSLYWEHLYGIHWSRNMSSSRRNHHHLRPWKLSNWQSPAQPVMKIPPKRRHLRFNAYKGHMMNIYTDIMDTWSGWLTRSEQKTYTNTADCHSSETQWSTIARVSSLDGRSWQIMHITSQLARHNGHCKQRPFWVWVQPIRDDVTLLLGFVRTRDTLVTIRGSSRIWRHPWRLTFQHSPRFRH